MIRNSQATLEPPALVNLPSVVAAKAGILVIGNFLSAFGKSRGVCEELASQLSSSGWRVITASSKVGRLSRSVNIIETILRRRKEYTVAQVDVYSGAAFNWAEMACLALRVLGKPYILTLHGGNLPVFAQRWPKRVRRLLASAQVVTTPSRYLLDQMRSYADNLRLVPNPICVDSYPFKLRSAPRPSLIWLRAFHSLYNPALAVSTVSQLVRSFPETRLTMIGPDKGDGSLERARNLARQLGIEGVIDFRGSISKREVPDCLQKGDLFLNTTNVDNTPISVLEAMACGLCVISTNVGGMPYLVEHEHDGILVDPKDPSAMARAVSRVLTENGLAARLSAHARNKVAAFDWSTILPEWEQLIHQSLTR